MNLPAVIRARAERITLILVVCTFTTYAALFSLSLTRFVA